MNQKLWQIFKIIANFDYYFLDKVENYSNKYSKNNSPPDSPSRTGRTLHYAPARAPNTQNSSPQRT
jgi:hypothetical protein